MAPEPELRREFERFIIEKQIPPGHMETVGA